MEKTRLVNLPIIGNVQHGEKINNKVKEYNSKIKKIPTNIIAGIAGFDEKEYFEVEEGKKEVPDVNFE